MTAGGGGAARLGHEVTLPVTEDCAADGAWRVTEEFLVNTADQSEKLARLPTHMAFWFGWYQFHPDTELYTGP